LFSKKKSIALLVYLSSCLKNIFLTVESVKLTKLPAITNFKAFSIGLISFISTVNPLNHVYRPRTTANMHNALLPLIKLHNTSKN